MTRTRSWEAADPGTCAGLPLRSGRGHTMVELMVVLAIMVAFALIAVPRFASVLLRNRLEAAMDGVRSDLHFARARTTATGLRHQVIVDAANQQLSVLAYRPDAAAQGQTDADSLFTVALKDSLPTDVRITEWFVTPVSQIQADGSRFAPAGVSDTPMVFYPEGVCDSSELVLENSQGDKRGLSIDGFSGEIRDLTEDELRNRR